MAGCGSKFNEIKNYIKEIAHIDRDGICENIRYETSLKALLTQSHLT